MASGNPSSHVRPPTSPVRLDPQAWARSIALVRRLAPWTLSPTHFGAFEDGLLQYFKKPLA